MAIASRRNGPNRLVCILTGATALIGGLSAHTGGAWAKHHESASQMTDPCASLSTTIQGHIVELKALKTAIEEEKHQAPKALEGVVELLAGKTVVDNEKIAKLADVRRQTDSLNSLLHLQGCKMVDVDRQLATP
jgi:hypothetical protein